MHIHSHNKESFSTYGPAAAGSRNQVMTLFVRSALAHDGGASSHDSPDAKYTGGLTGVDQLGNYTFINICLALALLAALFLALWRTWHFLVNGIRHQHCLGRESEYQRIYSRNHANFEAWAKRRIIYAPMWKTRHCKELLAFTVMGKHFSFGVLPLKKDITLISAYFLLNFIACFALDYTKPAAAVRAELRGRAGAMATANLMPTILFALRNNPLIYLLGVSFDTFNLYHRWIGRLVVLEALIHTLAFTTNWIEVHGASALNAGLVNGGFHLNGSLAMLFMLLIAFFAWSPIRHAWYETFVNIHRLVFWVILVTTWEHLAIAHLPQLRYIQATLVGYLLDWIWRVARVSYYNISRKRGMTVTTIQALPGEACKVSFTLAKGSSFGPGGFAHIYIPRFSPFTPWASHPFSLAWTTDAIQPGGPDVEKLGIPSPMDPDFDRPEHTRTTVDFITRARDGFTRAIYNAASQAPNKTITTFGFLEGPYGRQLSLASYGTAVLFAGGIGITAQLMQVRALLEGIEEGVVATRRIVLIWSIPDRNAMAWVREPMDHILRMPGRRECLKVLVFLTKPAATQDQHESHSGKVVMVPGRCVPLKILDDAISEQVGAMIVTACGPGPFMDAVRDAARARTENVKLDYVEEAFTY